MLDVQYKREFGFDQLLDLLTCNNAQFTHYEIKYNVYSFNENHEAVRFFWTFSFLIIVFSLSLARDLECEMWIKFKKWIFVVSFVEY